MNSNFSKFCDTPICQSSNSKFSKKFKRKRRKNKYKSLSTKKKNQKQFTFSKNVNVSEKFKFKNLLNKSQLNFDKKTFMSDWYWSNYKKAFEWQGKHSLAYWKSCALALHEENRHLLQIIKSLRPEITFRSSVNLVDESNKIPVNQTISNNTNFHASTSLNDRDYQSSESSENDEFEFEMSEEMIQYFEQSFKHKMNLEKEKKENELQEMDNKVKELQENRMKRGFEMKLLYGDDASKIIGMETAIQLSYDKYCDNKSPKYWPNIPLRL